AIVYDAPPFALLRCTVSVPAARGDTCPLATPSQQERSFTVGASRVIELGATPSRLAPQARTALDAAARAAVTIATQPVRLASGERYLAADLAVHTASQDLHASVFREPWDGPPLDGSSGGCVFLCAEPPGSGIQAPTDAWILAAQVRQGYRYATQSGQAVTAAPLMIADAVDRSDPALLAQLLLVQVHWNGAWQVSLDSIDKQPLTCQAGSA